MYVKVTCAFAQGWRPEHSTTMVCVEVGVPQVLAFVGADYAEITLTMESLFIKFHQFAFVMLLLAAIQQLRTFIRLHKNDH